jgi:ribonuclease R
MPPRPDAACWLGQFRDHKAKPDVGKAMRGIVTAFNLETVHRGFSDLCEAALRSTIACHHHDRHRRERHAMDAEREMVDLKKAQFMMNKIGEEFTGFINSLANFGFFVELDDYFIEGLVKLSSLTDDEYDYFEKEYVIKGRRHGKKFRLGDNVRVKVARINTFRSEIDFELVQTPEGNRS